MKPLACRIQHFRSIKDTAFTFSGDNVTVLAGQNEAGKTAVLLALRDFDLEPGQVPTTTDYMPEDDLDARPTIAVQFSLEPGDVDALQEDIDFPEFFRNLPALPVFWIARDLRSGEFILDPKLSSIWARAEHQRDETPPEASPTKEPIVTEVDDDQSEQPVTPSEADLAAAMRLRWPAFVYFDTFGDTLPRQVDVDSLLAPKTAAGVPQSVHDFIALAGIEPARIKELSDHDKALGNYLDQRGTVLTGDFLGYWQQKVDGRQDVNLRVRHLRDESGKLKLAFYVRDRVDQYPEQRSKGFLWFLSFYLRLAAEHKRSPGSARLLLVDEPGSYLHARAQRDVLHLFETRIGPIDQIVYSSHSPFLMPSHTLHRVRIVMKSAMHGTRVYDRLTHPDLRGDDFADTLTPLIDAIGIDVSQAFTFHKPLNLLVEGITDHIYITNWLRMYRPDVAAKLNVLPGFGATTLLTLASLFIGWGQRFGVLLDRDDEGVKTRDRFIREFLIPDERVVHPRDSITIEELFSAEDFRSLLQSLDASLTLEANESPSAALKRQKVDKVLLARTYAERVGRGDVELTKKTQQRIERLLDDLFDAVA